MPRPFEEAKPGFSGFDPPRKEGDTFEHDDLREQNMSRTEYEPPAYYIHQFGSDHKHGTMCGLVADPHSLRVPGSPTITCWLCLAILNGVVSSVTAQVWSDKHGDGESSR